MGQANCSCKGVSKECLVVLQGDDPAPPPMPSAPSSPKVAQPASASPACPAPAAAAPVAPAATAAPATRAAPAASASAAEKPPSARANRRASIMSDSISEQSSGGLAGRKPPTPLSLDGTSVRRPSLVIGADHIGLHCRLAQTAQTLRPAATNTGKECVVPCLKAW
ncbi:unnamed protein product [Durusdinium trenchii]|uniref:Uncharacterized protein n=1 Tax=Durusdinium trenchii TaxID=1381693 RepID=A0ABP0HCI7_9DINO